MSECAAAKLRSTGQRDKQTLVFRLSSGTRIHSGKAFTPSSFLRCLFALGLPRAHPPLLTVFVSIVSILSRKERKCFLTYKYFETGSGIDILPIVGGQPISERKLFIPAVFFLFTEPLKAVASCVTSAGKSVLMFYL